MTPSEIASGLSAELREAVWQFAMIGPKNDAWGTRGYDELVKLGILHGGPGRGYMTGKLYWPVYNALFSRHASDTPNPKASP